VAWALARLALHVRAMTHPDITILAVPEPILERPFRVHPAPLDLDLW